MRMPLVLLLAPVLFAPLARADSDDLSGGVLLVHAPPGVVYTTGTVAWCDSTHLADCEDQVTTITANAEAVWFVLSAWAEEKSFSAVEFGLGDFDAESFYFLEDGICLEDAMAIHYPSVEDWPGPNTGIALAATGDAWSGQLVPIACFAAYNYAEADTIAITENPATGHAGWVSGESRTPYDAECLGALGLGADGTACCPEGELDGQIGEGTAEDQAGTEFDGIDAEESGQDYLPDESGWVDLGDEPVPFDLHLGQSNGSSTVLEMTLDGFFATPVEIEEKTYYALSVAGEPASVDSCLPALPAVSRALMIPNDARMAVRVLSGEYVDLPAFPAAPSKGPLLMSVDPDTVPFCFDSLYQSNDPYPAEVAQLGRPYIFRDYRGIVVTLNPLQALPASDSLRVYTNLTVEVYADGIDTVNVLSEANRPTFLDRQFSLLYDQLFVNYEQASSLRSELPAEDGKMLIIAHDAFAANMDTFMSWKADRGLATKIVTTAMIGGNPPDPEDILSYIHSTYLSDSLAYVLFVGDSAEIPPGVMTIPFPGGTLTYRGDPIYALLEGGDSYPELFVGRFSAHAGWQVDTQVLRTISYERDLTSEEPWLARAFCMATDSIRACQPLTNTQWMAARAASLDSLGYSVSTLYDPPGGDTDDVATVVNNGIGVMFVSDHGEPDGWWARFPDFKRWHVAELTNFDMLPLIHAHSCDIGKFSQDTCFAEAWMWAQKDGRPTGAIAAHMSYYPMPQEGPQWAQEGVTRLLASQEVFSVGALLFGGSVYMMDRLGGASTGSLSWNVFGDPSLILRTVGRPTLWIQAGGSGDYPTIGAAVHASINDALIVLGNGVYEGPGNCEIEVRNKSLEIRSFGNDPETCIIDCGAAHRFMSWHRWQVGHELWLRGLTIRNGRVSEDGGAIRTTYGCLHLADCRLERNWARGNSHGGAVRCVQGALRADNCYFVGDSAGGFGGAVVAEQAFFENCSFYGNRAFTEGGAVVATDSLVMDHCTIVANATVLQQAAISPRTYCTSSLGNSIVAFNEGLGISAFSGNPGEVTLTCCDLFGNTLGDWEYYESDIEDQLGVTGNICADPLLCSIEDNNLHLTPGSPCLPESNPECGLLGAWSGGCDSGVWDEMTAGGPLLVGRLWFANPFAPPENIEWRLCDDQGGAPGVLSIVDVGGRLIVALEGGRGSLGTYSVCWDGKDGVGLPVAGGMYFFRLSAGKRTVTRRAVVVR